MKRTVKSALRKIAVSRARSKLAGIRGRCAPSAATIANAITEALDDVLTPAEEAWVAKIEDLREGLSRDSTELSITDYGVGGRRLTRTEEEMYEGVTVTKRVSSVCAASKSRFFALVLFKLVRAFKPKIVVELGTCLGISAAYQAAAQALNGDGHLVTLEGAPSLAELSEKNLAQLGVDRVRIVGGRFQDNLEAVFDEYAPIDFAFIDGHHDEKATISYFESFLPNLSNEAIVVFDDISSPAGMRRAWNAIKAHPRVQASFDLRVLGVCLLGDKTESKSNFYVPLI